MDMRADVHSVGRGRFLKGCSSILIALMDSLDLANRSVGLLGESDSVIRYYAVKALTSEKVSSQLAAAAAADASGRKRILDALILTATKENQPVVLGLLDEAVVRPVQRADDDDPGFGRETVLPFLFYRDGIRGLTFLPNVPPHELDALFDGDAAGLRAADRGPGREGES